MLNKLKVYNKPEDLAICFIVDLLSRLFPFKVVRTGTLTPVECISRQTEISGNLGQISACRLFLLQWMYSERCILYREVRTVMEYMYLTIIGSLSCARLLFYSTVPYYLLPSGTCTCKSLVRYR